MDPSVSVFRDEAVRYLDNEVVPDISNNYEHYPGCEVRPLNDTGIQIKNLQFLRRNRDGDVELVDTDLRTDRILLRFQYQSGANWETWDELLTQFTASTECDHLETPYAIKWENSGTVGKLKADERFDDDRRYIRERIGARDAMGRAIEVLLHEYLPRDVEQLTVSTEIPLLLRRLYNQKAEQMDDLRPT